MISITGNGLKTLEVVQDELPPPRVIEPKLSEFDKFLEDAKEKSAVPESARNLHASQRPSVELSYLEQCPFFRDLSIARMVGNYLGHVE